MHAPYEHELFEPWMDTSNGHKKALMIDYPEMEELQQEQDVFSKLAPDEEVTILMHGAFDLLLVPGGLR
jgi:hypothetical protein